VSLVGTMARALHSPLGHLEQVRGLWAADADDRLVHALLFDGPDGVGKYLSALHLAAGLFCSQGPGEPCGSCGPCHRFSSGGAESNHPDLLIVDPADWEWEQIKLEAIAPREDGEVPTRRSVEGFLDLSSVEGGHRLVIIREAHKMNAAAQNALLKTLEEPRAGTVLVLVTSRPEELLDTIMSRVMRVHFGRLDHTAAAHLIRELGPEGLDERMAADLARWSDGSPGRALRLLAQGRPAEREVVSALVGGKAGPIECSRRVWELDGDFPGKTERAKARARARAMIDLLLEVLLDLERFEAGRPGDELAHGDLVKSLSGRGRLPFERLPRVHELLRQCRADVLGNLTPEAVLDRAFLGLATLLP